MNDTHEVTAAERDTMIAGLGIEYRADFVPQRLSRNAGDKRPSLNWRLTLARSGKVCGVDYTQGIGNLDGYNDRAARTTTGDALIRKIVETGKVPVSFKADPYSEGISSLSKPLPAPPLADVLHSLLSDSEACDYPTYESWGPDVGYDADSRAGEAVWHECRRIGTAFRALFTVAEREALADALRDY